MADAEPTPPLMTGPELVSGLWALGQTLLFLLPVYLCGYMGLSIVFVIVGLAVYMGWKSKRHGKWNRLQLALDTLQNEEAVTATTISITKTELPSWVNFPDVEKAEWLNKLIAQMWPFIGQYLEKMLIDTIAPLIRSSNTHLSTFYFTKINLGQKAPKITGVKAHTEMDKKQIILDLNISYVGDVEIDVEVKKYFCKAGVKGAQLHGMMRVILEPLIGDVPIIGAITLFFIRRPMLDLNWTGLTNLLDIPGLDLISDTMIMDIISGFLVLPNRLAIPLAQDLHLAELRSPLPRGIVRIHLLEARSLSPKDFQMGGLLAGKSDPYAILRVGTQVFTSRTINENLNPVWNEMYEAIVHEVPGQELEVELFDKDPDKDDFLGRMKLDLGEVKKVQVLDKCFTLNGAKSGSIHLRLEWLTLQSNASQLEQMINLNKTISTKANEPSSAILIVYLDRADDLPLKKSLKQPNPVVQISIQDVTQESRPVYNTNCPVWEQPFRFFLRNPNLLDLDIQVKDDDRQQTLGTLSVPLNRILCADHLTLDQWFQLDNSGLKSRIYMKLVMRILYLDPNISVIAKPDTVDLEEASFGSSVDRPPRPSKTSLPESFATENVLRVYLLEAENLIAKDNFMGGMIKGKSDPYVVVRAGGKSVQTRVIKENLNPRWDQAFEILVTDVPGQDIEFQVFDKDIDKDDFLGRCKVPVKSVLKQKTIDEWLPLEEVKSGKLHVKVECLSHPTDAAQLEQVLMVNNLSQPANSDEFSSALLSVYLESAVNLPMKKGVKPPTASAEITVRKSTYKTKVASKSSSPVWEENFVFLVKNPSTEVLQVNVRDEASKSLGYLTMPLSDLLTADCFTVDGWFPLNSSEAEILMRAQLRILASPNVSPELNALTFKSADHPPRPPTPEKNEFNLESAVDNEDPSAGELRQRLQHTNSDPEPTASNVGQLHVTVYYPAKEGKLLAVMHSCRNLNVGSKELPDPYLSVLLVPDKNRATKRKTSVKKRTANPEFNEKLEWEIPVEEATRRKLEISVKNNVSFMSREKELIGKVIIDLSQVDLSKGVNQWYELKSDRSSV
ncbi:extended synaptotagmin-1 isoform X1 [Rana temporaria]|uniref:extended synaptotagmin-1 isoform X1 n=2 Tax=Rana temporaria TaxID=8407 RepID=UPI001AAE009E|nr:extended synaptotagmin-1 isoform X1 [Rana temporaria]XP_040197029.1 extended synaptotagmin-1 isoform X1 [Rana temporaria]